MQLKGLSSLDCVLIDPNPSSEQKHRVEMKDGKRRQQLNYTEKKRDLEDDFMSASAGMRRKKNNIKIMSKTFMMTKLESLPERKIKVWVLSL